MFHSQSKKGIVFTSQYLYLLQHFVNISMVLFHLLVGTYNVRYIFSLALKNWKNVLKNQSLKNQFSNKFSKFNKFSNLTPSWPWTTRTKTTKKVFWNRVKVYFRYFIGLFFPCSTLLFIKKTYKPITLKLTFSIFFNFVESGKYDRYCLQQATLLKNRTRHRCFPFRKFCKIFEITFFTDTRTNVSEMRYNI